MLKSEKEAPRLFKMIVNYGVQLKLKSLQWSKHSHSFINYYPLSIYFKILMYKSVINSWNLFYRNMGKYQKKNLLCFRLKWPSVIGYNFVYIPVDGEWQVLDGNMVVGNLWIWKTQRNFLDSS